MVIPLGNGAYVNVAHISLISGVQVAPNRSNVFQVRILLMGNHEHVQMGSQQEMEQLHARLKNGIDQLEAAAATPPRVG